MVDHPDGIPAFFTTAGAAAAAEPMRGDETLDNWVHDNHGDQYDWALLSTLTSLETTSSVATTPNKHVQSHLITFVA